MSAPLLFDNLLALTASEQTASSVTWVADVPDGWQQGRGAFGGLVGAFMLHAAKETLRHFNVAADTTRSVQANFLSPCLPGPLTLLCASLKQGSVVNAISVVALQGGSAVANATVVVASPRANPMNWDNHETPTPLPFLSLQALPKNLPVAPVFSKHFDFRPIGAWPFSGGDIAAHEGWVRSENARATLSEELLLAYADAYWPSAFIKMRAPRPAATVSFSLQFANPLMQVDGMAPVFVRAQAPFSKDGYVTEFREIWSESGQLLATNQQVIAIIA